MLFKDAVTVAVMVIVQAPLVVPPSFARSHVPPRTASLMPLTAPHVVELGTILIKALSVPAVRRSIVTNGTAARTPACSVTVVVEVTVAWLAPAAAFVVAVSVPLVKATYAPVLSAAAL